VLAALALAWSMGLAQSPQRNEVIFASADKAKFKEMIPGVFKGGPL